MKFEVGDIAISIEPKFFTNSYHYGSGIVARTVRSANEDRFTCRKRIDVNEFIAGCNEAAVHNQSNGVSMYGRHKLYHASKDKDEIAEVLRGAIANAEKLVDDEYAERIRKKLAELERLQSEIKSLEDRSSTLLSLIGLDGFKSQHAELLATYINPNY